MPEQSEKEKFLQQLDEVEAYFKTAELPATLRTSPCEVIVDLPRFIESHVITLRTNALNPTFLVYWERLLRAKRLCQQKPAEPAAAVLTEETSTKKTTKQKTKKKTDGTKSIFD